MEKETNKIFSIFKNLKNFIKRLFFSFSITEKFVVSILFIIFIFSAVNILTKIQDRYLVTVPRFGGTLKEGMIGTPRFINPVLATSHSDKSISNLIYSGLMTLDENGKPIPNLAESYSISEDGKIYTFILKDNIKFHDGEPVKVEDIIFTIKSIQDGRIKSPKQGSWIGVEVEKIDDKTVQFTLGSVFSPFIYNTTVGILPAHIWQSVSIDEFAHNQHNIEPIGSGPYMIKEIRRDKSGNPVFYVLQAFPDYALGRSFVKNIELHLYKNEEEALDAVKRKSIDSLFGIIPPNDLSGSYKTLTIDSSRIFSIYFNQSHQPSLASVELRKKLSESIDREILVNNILGGYGQSLNNIIPNFVDNSLDATTEVLNEQIKGQNNSEITFTIATSKVPELVRVGEFVVERWRELGVNASLDIYESGELTQNIIRSREYDALLFGQVLGYENDLYPFWHSSQRNDPGLNVAQYTNIDTDKWLKSLREIISKEEKKELLKKIETEVSKDVPAVFLYTPKFTYIVDKNTVIKTPAFLTDPSDRFLLVNEWYTETDKVLPIFAD